MTNTTTDFLIKHIRKSGIKINDEDKTLLINIGYYHGYKGYRFYKELNTKIPYSSFSEIYATYNFDIALKQLMYSHVVNIETSLKNIILECILLNTTDIYVQNMIDEVVESYKDNRLSKQNKKNAQKRKLFLQKRIYRILAEQYRKNNLTISHYYNSTKHTGVPVWALFENLMLGDFGYLVSCLNYKTKCLIAKKLNMNLSYDSNRDHIVTYIYLLKDLRNAIAHNAVIFDARFNKALIKKSITKEISNHCKGMNIDFKIIADYVIFLSVFLEKINVKNNTINKFLKDYLNIIDEYQSCVGVDVFNMVVKKGTKAKIKVLLNK